MGRLLAHTLARVGHQVTVYESLGADAQGSAARVAAAILAPLAESITTELPVVQMGLHALRRWPELIATLPKAVYFQQNGTLVLWHRQDAAEAKRFQQLICGSLQHLPHLSTACLLEEDSLRVNEPALDNRFTQALLLPNEGQLDNLQLLDALLKSLQQQNVALHWNSPRQVEDFVPSQGAHPNWVFDCRGLGARSAWSELRGVRGEIVRLYAPEITLQRPIRLVHPRYPIYIAPKENHVFVIGATEIETEDMSPASVRSTLELLSTAYTVHKGFAEARILDISTQARPTLTNNLPAVRFYGERTLQINGLYRHGFMISPAMLDVVMEWVQQGTTALAQQFQLKLEHV